jgi:uncharacterized protein
MPIDKSHRKRLVIDTNLFISAIIHPDRIAATGIKLAAIHFDIVVSPETLKELKSVPRRAYLDRYASIEDRILRVESYVDLLEEVTITEHVTDCGDPKDNMFLSTALAGGAKILISGDKRDLLSMNPYRGIEIITIRHFVDHYREYL